LRGVIDCIRECHAKAKRDSDDGFSDGEAQIREEAKSVPLPREFVDQIGTYEREIQKKSHSVAALQLNMSNLQRILKCMEWKALLLNLDRELQDFLKEKIGSEEEVIDKVIHEGARCVHGLEIKKILEKSAEGLRGRINQIESSQSGAVIDMTGSVTLPQQERVTWSDGNGFPQIRLWYHQGFFWSM